MSIVCEQEEGIPERTYDPEATCLKCAHDRVGTKYRPTTTYMFTPEQIRSRSGRRVEQHFLRTCERCGAWWKESVP